MKPSSDLGGGAVASEDILAITDATSVAAVLGTNKPLDSDKEGQEARKAAKDKGSALAEVYSTQAWVLLQRYQAALKSGDDAVEVKKDYDASLKELHKWADLNDPEYFYLWLVDKYAKQEGLSGKTIVELLKSRGRLKCWRPNVNQGGR